MTKQEKILNALKWLVDELEQYDVPQVDDNYEFSKETALGFAQAVLKEVNV